MMRPLRLAPRPGRRPRERSISVVPMINIVFLLLVFFLLTATIAPPDPVPVRLPLAETGEAAAGPQEDILLVAADGILALGDLRGEAVLAALADRSAGAPLTIRADADLDGAVFAGLLTRLQRLGVVDASVVVLAGGPREGPP